MTFFIPNLFYNYLLNVDESMGWDDQVRLNKVIVCNIIAD